MLTVVVRTQDKELEAMTERRKVRAMNRDRVTGRHHTSCVFITTSNEIFNLFLFILYESVSACLIFHEAMFHLCLLSFVIKVTWEENVSIQEEPHSHM